MVTLKCLPRLSIIIATYNAAATLVHCLDSIVTQVFEDWEIIIADGGSSDGTLEIVQQYRDRIIYWDSKRDAGIYDAWNQALIHARGEYVCFLGADDAWHAAETLQVIFDAIGDRSFDFVSGKGHLVDSKGNLLQSFGRAWNYRKIGRRMSVCHPGALHRRHLFERFGMFDTSYRICADYDFLLRLPADSRSLFIDRPLVDVADGGISRDRKWLMLQERYRVQANCPRVGRSRAMLNFIDKLWRIPVARLLGIYN